MDITKFKKEYIDAKGNLSDKFQSFIKLVPFTSNNASCWFDSTCGFNGIVGRFFRNLYPSEIEPIYNIDAALEKIRSYLIEQRQMQDNEAEHFVEISRNILCPDGNIQAIDASFLKYYPLILKGGNGNSRSSDKYISGQKKLADYLSCMTEKAIGDDELSGRKDLFTSEIKKALSNSLEITDKTSFHGDEEYYILPFVKKQFGQDFKWLLAKEDYVLIKYIGIFLYFYACYSILQTLLHIEPNDNEYGNAIPLYNILRQEHASMKSDAIRRGWESKLNKNKIDKTFGKLQAIDILNSLISDDTCIYHEIVTQLNEEPFEQNKVKCEELLKIYQEKKREHVNSRKTSKKLSMEVMDTSVDNYDEFTKKIYELCTRMQENTYTRVKNRIYALFSIRFLSLRRGKYLLNIDNEMLIFLIAMITHEQKTKLSDLYRKFREYGIIFNINTRNNIEQYLLKLNLLDRKSDSGEAQYVRVIL